MVTMMTTSTPIHALIVAAGKGTRFGATCPKQYLSLDGKTVLEHSVGCLADHRICDLTLVLVADDAYIDDVLPRLQADFCRPIFNAIGGAERWQSVQSGLKSIKAQGASDDDWVLIHDAARPCLSKADLATLIDAIVRMDAGQLQADAAILASPVVDTLKFVRDGIIDHTVSRQDLWQAMTPQVFRLGELIQILTQIDEQGMIITDEASAYEHYGRTVHIVSGSKMNMKLTYADDLPLLEMIIHYQKSSMIE